MQFTLFTTLSLLLTLPLTSSTPLPLHLHPRAGGPAIKSIPPTCTITNPLSNLTSPTSSNATTATWAPLDSTRASQVYAYYLPEPYWQNASTVWAQCLQQCYGYGNTGDCRAAVMAYDVPAPSLHGAPAGQLEIACLMFGRAIGEADFGRPRSEGTWTDLRAGVIEC